ncbi:MAG: efflux RND transporter permease subunit, partial [Deltaproteobacteria bacterium]|nr:efflux RND transporter permease subunit [Deltaproteobacteria bacterium]
VKQHDQKSLVFKVVQTAGSNVLVVMGKLKEALKDLNENYLIHRNLELKQVYDSTSYIYSSISRVRNNIFIGGALAVIVLLLFLRNISSVLVITAAIPVSIIGTFLMITLFGRNINVITLAGMSFAIGMVVDSSIVVLENIFRRYQQGESRFEAALNGTREVMGAIVASAFTTIAVFVPVVFVEEEAGQLFRDIAIAIASAVFLSLIVSITLIPSMSAKILRGGSEPRGIIRMLYGLGGKMGDIITGLVSWLLKTVWRKVLTVLTLTVLAAVAALALIPETEYLPEGNRNFVFGLLLPPPGYNNEQLGQIARNIADRMRPYWEADPLSKEAAALKGPPVGNFFFVARMRNVFMGCNSKIPGRARELIPVLRGAMSKVPGAYAVVQQGSLFARGLG